MYQEKKIIEEYIQNELIMPAFQDEIVEIIADSIKQYQFDEYCAI